MKRGHRVIRSGFKRRGTLSASRNRGLRCRLKQRRGGDMRKRRRVDEGLMGGGTDGQGDRRW